MKEYEWILNNQLTSPPKYIGQPTACILHPGHSTCCHFASESAGKMENQDISMSRKGKIKTFLAQVAYCLGLHLEGCLYRCMCISVHPSNS